MRAALLRLRGHVSAGAPRQWHSGYQPSSAPLVRSLFQIAWSRHASRWLGAAFGSSPWSRERFSFGPASFHYFDHRRTFTWLTERRVELALALGFVTGTRPDRLLEVGAVLPQFGIAGHAIVDRFEHGPGILNVDIGEFHPEGKFDRIVSISTIEHVGWDEEPRRPAAAGAALRRLVELLSPGGAALVTLPAGHHRALDAMLLSGESFGFLWRGLVRLDRANRWREVAPAEALRRSYGEPFLAANGLLVGIAGRSDFPAGSDPSSPPAAPATS